MRAVNIPEKGTLYRVRLGPYQSLDDANRIKTALSQNGVGAAIIRPPTKPENSKGNPHVTCATTSASRPPPPPRLRLAPAHAAQCAQQPFSTLSPPQPTEGGGKSR